MKNNIVPIILLLLGFLTACNNTMLGPESGQNLSVVKGCTACHAVDETSKVGPRWVGLYGSQIELDDGSFVTADDAYLIESIKKPNAKIVSGYTKGTMPGISLTDDELNALVAYIKSVK